MNKAEEIFQAWRIALTVEKDDPRYELACERIKICDVCEYKDTITLGDLSLFTRCTLCGCALRGKMFTPATYKDPGGSCPKEYWKDVEEKYLSENNK